MRFKLGKASRIGVIALALAAFGSIAVFAQGTQTGVITGAVSSTDGAALPGVTVTLSSPALQGDRTTTTDSVGAYIFRGLPPGEYKLSYALSGFSSVEIPMLLALGATVDVPATLGVAAVEESIEVLGQSSSILTETQVATNYKYEEVVDKLAMNRNLAAIATMAPGVSNNGPNIGQISVGGAFAYDNVFLLNGVDINDNLFGTANNVYIEDALQEISVISSGISAEYGRFSGGVVNAITKSGGNEFQGSFRTDLINSDWQDESLVEKNAIAAGRGQPHLDDTNFIHTATLGGPIVKDRLWFFGAARRADTSEARTLSIVGTGYTYTEENRRYEAKLTGRLGQNQRLQANYIRNSTSQNNNASINTTLSIDPRTLVNRTLPNDLFVARYDGVLSSNLFAEAQYSRKAFGFRNTGGTSTDVFDSPFRALGLAGLPANSHFNAPYFSSFDPEDRNNNQYAAALSYFLSTGSFGRHDLKLGGEYFTSYRTGGNSQSATGLVFFADPVMSGGQPVSDSGGFIMPNFQPGVSRIVNFRSVQGAQIDITTFSIYLNDRWQLNERWSFNVGARMERHSTEATQAGIVSLSSTSFAPRLGATFDVMGDGNWILQATFGKYSGKASETQFADNTNVGNPSSVTYQYQGPAGQGVGFAPGFDLANYRIIGGSFPVANIFIDDGLNTPSTREWTLQAGRRLGQRGEVKVIYNNRTTSSFLEDFITLDLGRTTVTDAGVNFGTFDNVIIRNTDDPHRREYQGLVFITNYRVTDRWYVGGNWTVQLRNHGNFEGEAANQPGNYSIIGDRPEFYTEARHFPFGRTDDYQQHKVRLYSTYDLGLGKLGTVTVGGIYRYDSPLTYSFAASNVPITAVQRSRDPGYARPPTTQTLYFGELGIGEFESSHLVDLSLSYDVPVYKRARPFFKAELRNAFNKQPLIGFNTTISADNNSPRDELGLPTGYTRGANFGTPLNNHTATAPHVPFPREFRFSVGLRF
jgi:hypothetical protein